MSPAPPGDRLTAAEIRTLDAVTARLIPSDDTGPGAREALVVRYIETALQTDYAAQLNEYRRGLAATDSYSHTRFGRPFGDLAEEEQDAVLTGYSGPKACWTAEEQAIEMIPAPGIETGQR
jgi:gluconate 2-dehydrogenase gamma chain